MWSRLVVSRQEMQICCAMSNIGVKLTSSSRLPRQSHIGSPYLKLQSSRSEEILHSKELEEKHGAASRPANLMPSRCRSSTNFYIATWLDANTPHRRDLFRDLPSTETSMIPSRRVQISSDLARVERDRIPIGSGKGILCLGKPKNGH